MPAVPNRWFFLLAANYFGWLVLYLLASIAPQRNAATELILLICASLGLPLSRFGLSLWHWFAFIVIFVNPFLWATIVEWWLQRFVDVPKGSDIV